MGNGSKLFEIQFIYVKKYCMAIYDITDMHKHSG